MLSYVLAICILKFITSTAGFEGKATYYGGNPSGGACGFKEVLKSSFPFGYYAATGSANFDDGYGCGKCFRITCIGPQDSTNTGCSCSSSTPTVTVQTIDNCPECPTNHFDLDPTAMALIVAPGLSGTCGVIEIDYEQIDCAVTESIRIRNKGGTSKWWYGLHVDNVAGPGYASDIKLLKNGKEIGYCSKNNGPSFWICTPSTGIFPDLPMDIKLTAGDGRSVTASNCITSYAGGAEMTCSGVNFDNNGGGSGSTSTTTTSTTSTTRNGNGNGKVGGIITIANKNGLNQWWYAVVITDTISNGVTIEGLKMKASNMVSYETGVFEWDYVKFTQNGPYAPPITFEITLSNGRTITRSNLISTLNEGEQGQVTVSSSFLTVDEKDNSLSWTAWFGICMIILIVIGIIIVSVYCFIKKQKSKIEVGFDNKYADDEDDNNKEDDDVNTNDKEDEQEIEVDVQLTTAP